MGNIVEEIIRRNAIAEGLAREEKRKYEATKRFIERKGVYNILYRTMLHLLPAGQKRNFELYMDGGSYTDGQKVVIGVLKYAWGMPDDLVYSILKALTGHETEHNVSSDFDLFVDFQRKIAYDFDNYVKTGKLPNKMGTLISSSGKSKKELENEFRNFNWNKQYGKKLGAHLLNSVEDGRIEKRLGNRMQGYVKHIKFMNALIWENQPVSGKDPLQEFLFSITSMCVTGLKSKNWDKVYAGTELNDLLNQVRPLIIKGINEPTAKGCAERTYEIFLAIAPKVAELVAQNQNAMDDMSMDFNFSGTSESSQGGSNGFPGNSISTHFTPESEDDESEENDSDKSQSTGQGKSKSGDKDQEGADKNGDDSTSSDGEEDQKGTSGQKNQDSSQSKGAKGNSEEEEASSSNNNNGSKEKQKENENDLTDHSQENAKKEEELVKDFLRNAKNELGLDLKNDMKQIKNEEAKIQREEERKKRESGNLSERELKDVLSGKGVPKFTQHVVNVNEKMLPDYIALPGKKLHRQLEKILQDKQGYTSRNRKRGVLDPTGVWKLGIKEYNTFVKKGKPDDSSYVVSVLVDNSGSMTGHVKGNKRKVDFAKEACAILEEGLKGLVPFRVTQFDDEYFYGVHHQVISDFGDTDKVNRTFSSETKTGGANADSISIRIATKELMKRPESKKILFVLSDGLPSSYYNEKDAITSVQNAVRDARKEGIIVIAICFGTENHLNKTRESYHKMYQKGIIMVEPQNIPTQLIKVLEREIK